MSLNTLTHLFLTAFLWSWGSYPYFTYEETGAWKGEVTPLGSNSQVINGRARASTWVGVSQRQVTVSGLW